MSAAMDRLLALMAALRDPERGCPWDLEQDFDSIAPYTLEEAYEVLEAIASGDREALRDELGDLLFQVVFHARMAEEEGAFSFDSVADGIVAKLTARHPHVFGDAEVLDASDQSQRWEAIKRAERAEDASQLAGVPLALPALKRAQKLGRRASAVGFDWPHAAPVLEKVHEELEELLEAEDAAATHEELGDLLFSVVNLARHLEVDAEAALADANRKFEARFRGVEAAAEADGLDLARMDIEALERLWEAQKKRR